MIALSCAIKISAVHCLALSQSTHVTDKQNYDFQNRASIARRAVIKRLTQFRSQKRKAYTRAFCVAISRVLVIAC